jgi:hypothetical protein
MLIKPLASMKRITARKERCDRALLTQELADEKDEFAIRHCEGWRSIAITLTETLSLREDNNYSLASSLIEAAAEHYLKPA